MHESRPSPTTRGAPDGGQDSLVPLGEPAAPSRTRRIRAAVGERGQVVMLTALLLLPLFLIGGTAVIDTGGVVTMRRDLQSTADLASLAGVVELPDTTQAVAIAAEWITRNGHDPADATIEPLSAGQDGCPAEQTVGCLRVSLTDRYDSVIAGVLGRGGWDVGGSATAMLGEGVSAPAPWPYTLMAIDPCPGGGGINIQGSATINLGPGASYSACNLRVENSGKIFGGAHQAAGSWISPAWMRNASYISPTPEIGLPVMADPLADLALPPQQNCTTRTLAPAWQGPQTIQPGCISNRIIMGGGGVFHFTSGVYVFRDGLEVANNAQLSSSGPVLIYITCPSGSCNGSTPFLVLGGGAQINLTGHPDYRNLALWIDPTANSSTTVSIGNNLALNWQGGIYHPAGRVHFNGGAHTSSMSVIAGRVQVDNNAQVSLPWTEEYAITTTVPVPGTARLIQ